MTVRMLRVVKWRDEIVEVGPGFDSTYCASSTVVGARRLLRRVEGSEPPPHFGLRVSYLSGVTARFTTANTAVPNWIAVFQRPLVGGGGGALL
ncbi:hypothetical protein U1Q18_010352 [Sarracenia purpurea var. burkii]